MAGLAFGFGVWAPFAWFLASLLAGYLLLKAVEAGRPTVRVGLSESLFRCVVAGFLVVLGIAFILAEVGRFRLRWLVATLAAVMLIALLWAWRRGASWRLPKPSWEDLLPVVLLLTVVGLTFRPHVYTVGPGDQGTYISIAGSIAREESIAFLDPDVAALDPLWAQKEFFFASGSATHATSVNDAPTQSSYFGGFNLDNNSPGKVVPGFFHSFPTWLALNYKFGDIEGMLQALPWTGILGILAVYFAARVLFNRRTAFAGALLLSVNLTFTWFHRYPASESLAQPFLLVTIYGLARHFKNQDKGAEILAALSLGALLHTQLDSILALGVVAAWLVWITGQRLTKRGHWRTFLILVGLQLLHWAVYARTTAWTYVLSAGGALFRSTLLSAVLILFGVGIVTGAFGTLRRWLARNTHWVRLALIGLIAAVALFAYFVPMILSPPQSASDGAASRSVATHNGPDLVQLGWYLTPWGIWLGVIGLLLFLRRGRLSLVGLLLGPALAYGMTYLHNGLGVPEHVETARYFTVALIPGLLLGAAYLLDWAWDVLPGRAGRLVPLALGCYLLAATGAPSVTLADHADYYGAVGAVRQLAAEVEDEGIVLFSDPSEALVFGMPLRFLCGRQVFTLQRGQPDTVTLRTLVERWESEGRPTYVIAPQGTSRISLHEFYLSRRVVFSLRFPHLERTAEHLPSQVETIAYDFALYRLRLLPALAPGDEITIDIGSDDDAYVGRGFHQKETTGDGRSFRWTEGEAEIELPGTWFCSHSPLTLTLVLSQHWASPETPTTLEVQLGETTLGQLTPPPSWQAVRLPISEALGPRMCQQEVVLLRLSGPTWVPATSGSIDWRALGVSLDRVILKKP